MTRLMVILKLPNSSKRVFSIFYLGRCFNDVLVFILIEIEITTMYLLILIIRHPLSCFFSFSIPQKLRGRISLGFFLLIIG